ncbi:hypothetical protein TWF696_001628 [Orbilia brochopaga]|uniref:Uncharacterized protein n=1 Tax=Orbilia brochopaga TaxID=3140254 RepID=A0AAV9U987_9PEZI
MGLANELYRSNEQAEESIDFGDPNTQPTDFINPNDFIETASSPNRNRANTRVIETGPFINLSDNTRMNEESQSRSPLMEVLNIPTPNLNTGLNNLASGGTTGTTQGGLPTFPSGGMSTERPGINPTEVRNTIVEEQPRAANIRAGTTEAGTLSRGQEQNQGQALGMPPPGRIPTRFQIQEQGSPVPDWENPALLNNRLVYWSDVKEMDAPYFTKLASILQNSDNLIVEALRNLAKDEDLANTDAYLKEIERLSRQRTQDLLRNEQSYFEKLKELGVELKLKDKLVLAGTWDPRINERRVTRPVSTLQANQPGGQPQNFQQEPLPPDESTVNRPSGNLDTNRRFQSE